MKLEIAVVGAAGAGTAASEGADRVELCSSLELGGVTPSQGLMEASLEHADGRLEVHPLVRSRPGDFLYSASDIDTMAHEIRHLLRMGAHGVVIGALIPDGGVDVAAIQRLVGVARGANPDAQLTFHRAIDQSADPLAAMDQLLELGFTRVLTSGGAASAGAGLDTLRRMVERADGALEIMAGGGLTVQDIQSMHAAGVSAVHLSAKRTVSTLVGIPRATEKSPSGAISLGSQDGTDPTAYTVTDWATVRAARAAVDAVSTASGTKSGTGI
ncbi:copper homeostasis protein CutC [Paenarthrobacter ilicis]|uniref:copper homeostasis protein CutC n=1 Tax=Paenarthrobacter ilicis TaxID=43665 RepID=UPI003008A0F9